MGCRGCNKELKSWESDDSVCSRCGKPICKHCSVIDMGGCLCNDCCDAIENDKFKCYSCNHYILDNNISDDYPVCRCKDSSCYMESIFHISVEDEKNCYYYDKASWFGK